MGNEFSKLQEILLTILGGPNSASNTAFGETSVAENRAQVGWGPFRNLKPQHVLTYPINGGSADVVNNFARVQSGTAINGGCAIRTRGYFSYNAGIGEIARWTSLYTTPKADNEQWIGPFDFDESTLAPLNGWAVGYKGLDFGFARFTDGAEAEFVLKENWNMDRMEELDTTLGNVYQLKAQWLGYGAQVLSMESSDTAGVFKDAHMIDYANRHENTSVEYPSVPFSMVVRNTGNNTNMVLRSPSAYVASQGEAFPNAFTVLQGYRYQLTAFTGGAETLAFTLRNPDQYLGLKNYAFVQPLLLNLVGDDTTPVYFDVYLNATLTGASYIPIDTDNGPAEIDESATAFSGGTLIATFGIARDNHNSVNLNDLDIKLWPSDTLTFTVTPDTNARASLSLTMRSRI